MDEGLDEAKSRDEEKGTSIEAYKSEAMPEGPKAHVKSQWRRVVDFVLGQWFMVSSTAK